ncbi:MAG: DUF3943 domain-containing protein, partial [Spirochaetaceae bacterium]|nr:DUF3943 domain-containing protein [Spirochaetaceae bacterium]
MMTPRMARHLAVFLLTLIAVPLFPQSENIPPASAANGVQKRNLPADIFYTLLDINTSNVVLNFGARLANAGFAGVTFETRARNIYPSTWFWEDGDRFIVNQLGHPYQGSTYFAAARVNGFNFFESMPFALAGSLQWEIMFEPASSLNDVIATTIGGISLGEMLHRLFLEVDESPSAGAKIGGFFVSPIGSFNAVYNRPKRGRGGGAIYELQVKAGTEKSFAHFLGHEDEESSWQYPGAYIGMNVIYGNPFTQISRMPYSHFELSAEITTNVSSYNIELLSDGYIFSFTLAQTQKTFASTGLTMHYDFFNATNSIIDNAGYGNIQFSSNSFDWTVKHAVVFSERLILTIKAHAGLTFWGTSMYNGGVSAGDYWVDLGNTRSTYGTGENIKLFFSVSHKNAGTLKLSAAGYHIFNIPVSANHSKGNVFFLNTSIAY